MRKKIAALCLAGTLLGGIGLGAYADSNLETISAYLNKGLSFKVNGSAWTPASSAITYNNSTYIPIRAAADALGVKTGYDETSKTVTLDSPASGAGVSYYFTQPGDHPENALVSLIGEAKSTLDIAIYSLTLPEIVQAILDAKGRGVNVRIISDKTEAKTKSQAAALKQLKDAGIPIKINTHSGLMHLKVTIVDKKVFTSGSFNYSKAASTTNDEVLIVDRDPTAAAKWDAEFNVMWNDNKKFADL